MNEALATEIRDVLLTPVRLREGYDMGQVDDLLDALELAVREGRDVQAMIDQVQLAAVRFREGYDMREVDDLLDRVANEMQRRQGAGLPPAVPLSQHSDHPGNYPTAEQASPSSRPAETTTSPTPSVIEEQRGVLSRLFRRKR